ncbi:MAG: response regulator [bacterium]|nr:response regulator [bacterium]
MKILFADDSSVVRNATVGWLEELGHEVVAVSDGESALKALKKGAEFDVLVTDYNMPPGINGLELMKAVKQFRPTMRAIMCAFNAPKKVEKEVRALGEYFVPKGLNTLEDVLREIEQSLKPKAG